jgi:RNA polymerase sigma factor (sigma-70 family)
MSAETAPTVFVVEDDEAVRNSLAVLLRLEGLRAEGFASAEEFLAAVRPGWSGCLVVDLRMPGMGGLELLERLRELGCPLPAIIITAHGDVANTRSSFRAGAVDFFEKPVENAALLAAIRQALDRDAARRREEGERAQVLERLARLTPREREVLDLVAAGRHNREIAGALGISPRTVEVYKARMMEKLQVRRLPDLVRLVLGARDPGQTKQG